MTTSVSDSEPDRRWHAAREIMRERNIDCLICRNGEEYLGGYVRWFTDIPANHNYPFAINQVAWTAVTDNFLVMERGESVWIHRTPKEILEV